MKTFIEEIEKPLFDDTYCNRECIYFKTLPYEIDHCNLFNKDMKYNYKKSSNTRCRQCKKWFKGD